MLIKEYRINFNENIKRYIEEGQPLTLTTDEVEGILLENIDGVLRIGTPTEHYLIKHKHLIKLFKDKKIKPGYNLRIAGNKNGLLRVYKYYPKYEDYMPIGTKPGDLKGVTMKKTKQRPYYMVYRHHNGKNETYGTLYNLSDAIILNTYMKRRNYPANAKRDRIDAKHITKQINFLLTENRFQHIEEIYKKLDNFYDGTNRPTIDQVTINPHPTIQEQIDQLKTELMKVKQEVEQLKAGGVSE